MAITFAFKCIKVKVNIKFLTQPGPGVRGSKASCGRRLPRWTAQVGTFSATAGSSTEQRPHAARYWSPLHATTSGRTSLAPALLGVSPRSCQTGRHLAACLPAALHSGASASPVHWEQMQPPPAETPESFSVVAQNTCLSSPAP